MSHGVRPEPQLVCPSRAGFALARIESTTDCRLLLT